MNTVFPPQGKITALKTFLLSGIIKSSKERKQNLNKRFTETGNTQQLKNSEKTEEKHH